MKRKDGRGGSANIGLNPRLYFGNEMNILNKCTEKEIETALSPKIAQFIIQVR